MTGDEVFVVVFVGFILFAAIGIAAERLEDWLFEREE